jgi:hypothetical protein
MHIDLNQIIALGVAAHLLGAIAKTLFHSPKQQAQIDAIEAKLDNVVATVQAVAGGSANANG